MTPRRTKTLALLGVVAGSLALDCAQGESLGELASPFEPNDGGDDAAMTTGAGGDEHAGSGGTAGSEASGGSAETGAVGAGGGTESEAGAETSTGSGGSSGSDDGGSGAGGGGGSGGAAGTGGTAGADGGAGTGGGGSPGCAFTVDLNVYTPTNAGCGGYAMCKGQLHFINSTATAWTSPIIKFTVADGVSCTKTHSSKWTITDNGATSHQCVFTATPGLVMIPAGGNWGFGYDTTQTNAAPPTNVGIADSSCN